MVMMSKAHISRLIGALLDGLDSLLDVLNQMHCEGSLIATRCGVPGDCGCPWCSLHRVEDELRVGI